MMALTSKKIQDRLADLKKQLEKAVSNVNALAGAIQDCEFWLAEIEKTDDVKDAQSG